LTYKADQSSREIKGDPLGVRVHQRQRRHPPAAQIGDEILPIRAAEAVKQRGH
jgi:hypothetical protein